MTGETVSASQLNTHLRDDMLETAPAKAAAAGDLFYATAANTVTVLSKGTKGEHLVMNDGETAPEWVPSDVMDRDMTTVTVNNDASEQTLYSHSVAANTLGTTGGIRFTVAGDYLNNTGGNAALLIRIKFGATTILTSNTITILTGGARRSWLLWGLMFNTTASAQRLIAHFFLEQSGSGALTIQNTNTTSGRTAGSGYGTGALDTTSAQTFLVSSDHGAADVNLEIVKTMGLIERFAAA